MARGAYFGWVGLASYDICGRVRSKVGEEEGKSVHDNEHPTDLDQLFVQETH